MIRHLRLTLAAIILCLIVAKPSMAQVDLSQLIGVPEHAHTMPVRFGFVNLDNGNLHLEIPLYSSPERGHPALATTLVYDSAFWRAVDLDGNGLNVNYPMTGGWGGGGTFYADQMGSAVTGIVYEILPCSQYYTAQKGFIYIYTGFTSVDPHNTTRTFQVSEMADAQCQYTQAGQGTPPEDSAPTAAGFPQNGSAYAQDGSGYLLTVNHANGYEQTTITAPNGTAGATPNGNLFDIEYNLVDELGASYPTITGVVSSQYVGGGTQPYTHLNNQTGTLTRQVWDSTANSVTQALYQYSWEYIPVCTGSKSTDYCGGMWALASIKLPDGEYQFGYDQGLTAPHFGVLTSITLPTGGIVSYGYQPSQSSSSGPGSPLISPQLTSITDNGGTTSINYSAYGAASGLNLLDNPGAFYPVTVTSPAHPTSAGGTSTTQDKTVYSATENTQGTQSTFTKKEYSGSSSLLRTTTTTTDQYGRAQSVVAVWAATGESHEVDYKYADDTSIPGYETYGQLGINMVRLQTEYDSGVLVRSLQTNYLQDTSAIKYVSQHNMINYPSSVTLMDASGSTVSQVQYTYDEYSASYCSQHYPKGLSGISMLTSITGAAGHDDTNYGTGYAARGNPTTIRYSGVNAASVATHKCYDTLGNVTQTIDGNGNATRYSYADSFYESACFPNVATQPTYAFPTAVWDALGHKTTTSYYSCNREARAVLGPNDIADGDSGTVSTYDTAFRPSCVSTPDGGQTCYTYPSQTEIDTTSLVSSGVSHTIQSFVDSYGRSIKSLDSNSGIEIDTSFDEFGRKNSVSNPHIQGASPSDGTTYFAYDALGRQANDLYPDGTRESWIYTGNTVLYKDPHGNQWQRTSDSLGRLTKVLEPNGTSQTPSMETDYSSYDVLNDLLSVAQCGGACSSSSPVVRQFSYDGLGRLVAANNPENQSPPDSPASLTCANTPSGSVWTSCYSYDADNNLKTRTSPLVNAGGLDTQTIGYCYDGLNRKTYEFYSGSFSCTNPSGYAASYTYDTSTVQNALNVIGKLTDEKAYVAGTMVSERKPYWYDAIGRLMGEQQCPFGSSCANQYVFNYVYDLAGDLTSSANVFASVSYSYDSASRLNGVTGYNNNGCRTPPCSTDAVYTASQFGPVGVLGGSYGNNLFNFSRLYDNRTRIVDSEVYPNTDAFGSGTVTISGTLASGDTGTVSLTVGGVAVSVPYGSGNNNTAEMIAQALATAISQAKLTPVTAKVTTSTSTPATIQLNAILAGTTGNVALSIISTDANSSSTSSFTVTKSGNTLALGTGKQAYYYQLSYNSNGNLYSSNDMYNSGFTYGYDTLNRLIASAGNGSTLQINGTNYTNQCWTYDAFGNRMSELDQKGGCPGQAPSASNYSVWATYNANNQVTGTGVAPGGFYYDDAGNVYFDGVNQYVYDQDGRMCAAYNGNTGSMTQYVYDAEGRRVAKGFHLIVAGKHRFLFGAHHCQRLFPYRRLLARFAGEPGYGTGRQLQLGAFEHLWSQWAGGNLHRIRAFLRLYGLAWHQARASSWKRICGRPVAVVLDRRPVRGLPDPAWFRNRRN